MILHLFLIWLLFDNNFILQYSGDSPVVKLTCCASTALVCDGVVGNSIMIPVGRQLCSFGEAVPALHCRLLPCAQFWARCKRTTACNGAKAVAPDTDIAATLMTAADVVGISAGQAQQLSEHLKDNWYNSAGDVAAMSKDELQQLRIPVKLWAVIKDMVAAGKLHTPAAADMDTQAELVMSSSIAAASASQLQQAVALRQQAGSAQPVQPLPADIMERRMPCNVYGGGSLKRGSVRVRAAVHKDKAAYSLKEVNMPSSLLAEFQKLQDFSCGTFYGQRVEPMRLVSYQGYRKELRGMLGYLHHIRGVPLEQLSFDTLIPTFNRDGVSLLMEYQHWRETERGVAARSQVVPIKAAIILTRYLYHQQSNPSAKPPYRDLPVMQELANMLKAGNKAASTAPMVSDESKKWLGWDEYIGLVRALQAECAGLTAKGKPRVRAEVAGSLQKYLVVAILSVIPDRQRTLRELEVGRTLVKHADGSWIIKHSAADYKTGRKYGDRPPLVIAPFIYPELEAYISTWRQELNPKTTKLFCKLHTGEEHTESSMHTLFTTAALRLTGKATNPHLVRDMIVTHLRDQGASEHDMESLALMMAHSIKEQRSTYDRRTKDQKVRPAVDLMLELSKGL